jgi:hypothetical protein
MITIETGTNPTWPWEKSNWLKGIPYESTVVIYDSRRTGITECGEKSAFYFGYNGRENSHIFLREEKGKVEVYTIRDDKCWVKYWDGETYIPCLDTRYVGNLEKTGRFPDEKEREYVLQRLKKLKEKN